jgi:malate dehydrogenase (oxaloacetate-decarboxylating)
MFRRGDYLFKVSTLTDFQLEALKMHKEDQGKISVTSKVALNNQRDLSLAYSPGVAEPCKAIYDDPEKVYDYTIKGNLVAVVTDGSAV